MTNGLCCVTAARNDKLIPVAHNKTRGLSGVAHVRNISLETVHEKCMDNSCYMFKMKL